MINKRTEKASDEWGIMSLIEEIGKRAVNCKGWRWMPGMRWVLPDHHGGARTLAVGEDAIGTAAFNDVRLDRHSGSHGFARPLYPDLTDPATIGCLLYLVRESWSARAWTVALGR